MKPHRKDPMTCTHDKLHENYLATGKCATPYCHWYEVHCRECGYFVSSCGCGFNDGLSGWSYARRQAHAESKRAILKG